MPSPFNSTIKKELFSQNNHSSCLLLVTLHMMTMNGLDRCQSVQLGYYVLQDGNIQDFIKKSVNPTLFVHCRCGLRGGYAELIGFSKEVKHQSKKFMSPG